MCLVCESCYHLKVVGAFSQELHLINETGFNAECMEIGFQGALGR